MKTSLSKATATSVLLGVILPAWADALPPFIVPGSVQITEFDGVSDDLLSAGLNVAGLVEVRPPTFADPNNPTPEELRRNAIHQNFRGIVDPVPQGGMGLLWGPGSMNAPSFAPPVVHGLIPGMEYKAYFRAPGRFGNLNNIAIVVQIPRNFDLGNPCIVSAPPSGSRGVYGGIAVGEWGLFNGCAVALGGKGTGTGFHLLGENHADFAVNDTDGLYGSIDEVGNNAQFRVRNSRRLQDFLAEHPDRVAVKHAHSQVNPERLWGQFALNAIRFAFWALNDYFKDQDVPSFEPENTTVIATGASNGAGASVRSLEDDRLGLIDGLVVSEPSINPKNGPFVIRFGDQLFDPDGQTLNDSITLMGTYASCAALAPQLQGTPFFNCEPRSLDPTGSFPTLANFENRCQSLHELGLLTSTTLEEQAEEALSILGENGYYEEQHWGIASHECLNLWRSLQPTYSGSYGRFAVWKNVCNVSFAATDTNGSPVPVTESVARALFATSSGLPATSGINLIADDAFNGPILENQAISPSTAREDLNLEGALCFRYLSTGDPRVLPRAVTPNDLIDHLRVRAGAYQLQTTGDLHGKPAIIIQGREDALVFPNHHSRAYYALNQVVEGTNSNLRYWEVTPAQHFDTFISSLWPLGPDGSAGPVEFVPLNFYLSAGLDVMYDYLKNGTPLPSSQVVRATPRGDQAYTADNIAALLPVPKSDAELPEGDRITFAAGVLTIPK